MYRCDVPADPSGANISASITIQRQGVCLIDFLCKYIYVLRNVLAYVYTLVINMVRFLNIVLQVAISNGLLSHCVVLTSVWKEAELYVGVATVCNLCST